MASVSKPVAGSNFSAALLKPSNPPAAPKPSSAQRKLATGPQLWRLNQLGMLRDAIEADGKIYSDIASALVTQAAAEGLFTPWGVRTPDAPALPAAVLPKRLPPNGC